MSSDLYSTLLIWDSRTGLAMLHRKRAALTSAPDLGNGPIHACEYTPEIGVAWVQQRAVDSKRDMQREPVNEIAAADALLAALTKDTT